MECTRNAAIKVETTDYLGQKVTVLYYELDGMRVREWPDGSMLIELCAGRFRYFSSEHWMAQQARGEVNGEALVRLQMARFEEARRGMAAGTHEPVTYYLDKDGRIGIPPEPGLPPPDNVTVHTFNTLQEADRLAARMTEQMYAEFQDDGHATAAFDQMTGVGDGQPYSRADLVHAMSHGRGRKERDVARLMLADLDQEESNRQAISTRALFHWREYDH